MTHQLKQFAHKTLTSDFTKEFPGDHSYNPTPRQTPGMLYALTTPEQAPDPNLLAISSQLAHDFQIDPELSPESLSILAGNPALPETWQAFASCYGGHQFGHWAGQLGDGRALTLGNLPDQRGHMHEFQLKGAGLTPYSRTADGKAVLRSSLREYLMSEGMHHLGVPTTRALSLATTGEKVLRDMLYDGHPAHETGAVVCRVAPSFIRFGHFELLHSTGSKNLLLNLRDFVIHRFASDIEANDPNKTFLWLKQVYKKTAEMLCHWLRVGFTHGVMNSDNMSILGLTIDYGPYGMLDAMDFRFTPNTTDLPGRRYCFGRQPGICDFNLKLLTHCFADELSHDQFEYLNTECFAQEFKELFARTMQAKLGIAPDAKNHPLVDKTLQCLQEMHLDYTLFFRQLTEDFAKQIASFDLGRYKQLSYEPGANLDPNQLKTILEELLAKHQQQSVEMREEALLKMKAVNPVFILRNYLLYQCWQDIERGDLKLLRQLEDSLQHPYDHNHPKELVKKAPAWALSTPGCSQLSCSS